MVLAIDAHCAIPGHRRDGVVELTADAHVPPDVGHQRRLPGRRPTTTPPQVAVSYRSTPARIPPMKDFRFRRHGRHATEHTMVAVLILWTA